MLAGGLHSLGARRRLNFRFPHQPWTMVEIRTQDMPESRSHHGSSTMTRWGSYRFCGSRRHVVAVTLNRLDISNRVTGNGPLSIARTLAGSAQAPAILGTMGTPCLQFPPGPKRSVRSASDIRANQGTLCGSSERVRARPGRSTVHNSNYL